LYFLYTQAHTQLQDYLPLSAAENENDLGRNFNKILIFSSARTAIARGAKRIFNKMFYGFLFEILCLLIFCQQNLAAYRLCKINGKYL